MTRGQPLLRTRMAQRRTAGTPVRPLSTRQPRRPHRDLRSPPSTPSTRRAHPAPRTRPQTLTSPTRASRTTTPQARTRSRTSPTRSVRTRMAHTRAERTRTTRARTRAGSAQDGLPPMLNAADQAVIESATLAHLVTINKNGPPRTVAWVGLKGGEPVSAHLAERPKKLANSRRAG